jgi:cytochrome d ubiquinol oxidase subunit I
LTDFFAVITQRFAILEFLHTLGGAYILAGFFVMGVSAWHLLRKSHVAFFTKSLKLAATFSLVFSLFELAQGHMNAEILGEMQPTKLAAMEAHWETVARAPIHLIAWPDQANARNSIEALPIPGMLSLLAHYDMNATVKGLKEFPPEDRPPVLASFLSFRIMVGLGILFIGLSFLAFLWRHDPLRRPWLLPILVWSIPLPYIANELGWTLAEIGRQPWIVYGLMRTKDAVSLAIDSTQVATTLVGFVLVYGLLGFVDFYLLFKYARRGPEPAGR